MVFYTCAVCEVELGLCHLHALQDVLALIASSGIPVLYARLVEPLHDPAASEQEHAYARAVADELPGGLLKGARHVCNDCVRQISGTTSSSASASEDGRTPARALVNGYFRGACPPELTGLTRVEVSMITIINVCVTVTMLQGGGHWGSQGTVFSVLNDVAEVAEFLPLNPTPAQHAVIRTESTVIPRDYVYNPHRVLLALRWLEHNNHLYAGNTATSVLVAQGHLDESWSGAGKDEDMEPEHISAESSDLIGIEEKDRAVPAGEDGHAVNPGAPPSSMTDVFLQGGQDYANNLQQFRAIVDRAVPPVVTVRQYGEYTRDYDVDYFLGKAFPLLYPYGRGCPNNNAVKFDGQYISHVLHLGGGRAFQQSPSFIFYSYSWFMKAKSGSISYQATKNHDGFPEELSVDAVTEFLENLRSDPEAHGITKAEQRALLSKLKPYANQVPGTELYFEKERKNLITMITSPVTTCVGNWTWFFTEAQSDKYLVEIFDNAVTSARSALRTDIGAAIEERRQVGNGLSSVQRNKILRDHPFLSARIHQLQQEAFWKYVLNGEDNSALALSNKH